MEKYDHKKIEEKWQKAWADTDIYTAPKDPSKDKKMYVLPQLPYPSGEGLHVGHAEVYTACDIIARYNRLKGKDVFQAIGWDAFGLPAENYAIKTNTHPRISTDKAIDNFRNQIKSLGISVDWAREVGSHNPDYYKWTQWLFLLMYERGLAYRKEQSVNWCDSCKTTLANEQVVDGKCERCEHEVIQKPMEQWFFKITEYADRLYDDLDKVDWPKETVTRQRNWIGKSKGVEINFEIKNSVTKIPVFTTRADTIFGVTYLVLAPEHPLLNELDYKNEESVKKYIESTLKKSELDRQIEKEKTGVCLEGVSAVNPANGKEIPVWIADYVLASYGTGAIMAVPRHDERDQEFAHKFGLEMGDGELRDTDEVVKLVGGERKTNYKLRDWLVSRQRFWGAPIPVVYDPEGKPHPLNLADLPVVLPDDVDFKPTGQSPLTYSDEFQTGVEEKFGKGWKREVDTLDTFVCSSWYYYRYLDPKNESEFASKSELKKWMPIDFYLGGEEHVNGHLLYSRFITKVLFDAGYVDFDEPFTKTRHQGLILGEDHRKMSKRWGNVINPTDMVDRFGADTTRIYEMFMGPLEDTKPWDMNGMVGVRRFIEKVWRISEKVTDKEIDSNHLSLLHKTVRKVGEDIEKLSFNTAVSSMMELVNEYQKEDKIPHKEYTTLLVLLAPFAPHITEELWQKIGHEDSIHLESWPEYDESKLMNEKVVIAIQVNGKVRGEFEAEIGILEDEAKEKALGNTDIQKWINGKEIKRIIFVKGKIISIVTS